MGGSRPRFDDHGTCLACMGCSTFAKCEVCEQWPDSRWKSISSKAARKELSRIRKKSVAGDMPSESSCTSTTAATKSGTSSLKSKKKKSGTVSKKTAVATATPIGKLTDKYAAAPSSGAVQGDGPVQSHGVVRSAGAVHGDGAVGCCGPW